MLEALGGYGRVLVADFPDVPVAAGVGPGGTDNILPGAGLVDRHQDDVDLTALGSGHPVHGHDRDPAAVREEAGEFPPRADRILDDPLDYLRLQLRPVGVRAELGHDLE